MNEWLNALVPLTIIAMWLILLPAVTLKWVAVECLRAPSRRRASSIAFVRTLPRTPHMGLECSRNTFWLSSLRSQ